MPIKYFLWRQGLLRSAECRLPLTQVSPQLGARRVACEDPEHLTVGGRVRVLIVNKPKLENKLEMSSRTASLPLASDLRVVIDVAAIAAVPEADADAHLVSTAVIADQLAAGIEGIASNRCSVA